eukprot:CAMPEP_0170521508 /NCGR_PEP_ID=MMETSP0209-20121228/6876_1 /TAXON_ID=665100 ORGANISM="Litonotus pictus, Strain P1" /NCGR_SAMPLE_ID=MMETSP0209 /ASSEMBLY_ACC=CAM_ASM_000301 /LENGTH=145 /DNA_ID=CAMNT_0010808421 /DNA_START=1 /DNA_END=435 /DNA_ORIENTATION=+
MSNFVGGKSSSNSISSFKLRNSKDKDRDPNIIISNSHNNRNTETRSTLRVVRDKHVPKGTTRSSSLSLNHVNYLHNLGGSGTIAINEEEEYERVRILDLASSMKELKETLDSASQTKQMKANKLSKQGKNQEKTGSLSHRISIFK